MILMDELCDIMHACQLHDDLTYSMHIIKICMVLYESENWFNRIHGEEHDNCS